MQTVYVDIPPSPTYFALTIFVNAFNFKHPFSFRGESRKCTRGREVTHHQGCNSARGGRRIQRKGVVWKSAVKSGWNDGPIFPGKCVNDTKLSGLCLFVSVAENMGCIRSHSHALPLDPRWVYCSIGLWLVQVKCVYCRLPLVARRV